MALMAPETRRWDTHTTHLISPILIGGGRIPTLRALRFVAWSFMYGGSGIKNLDASPVSRAGRTSSEIVFAADLGGTHLRSATIDENGQINFRLKERTPHAIEPDEIVRALVQAVRQCEMQGKISGDRIRAVSVVVPGSVNVEQGVVVKAPNVAC